MKKLIELLAPAKDLTCGKEAVLHGADAVYIGAPKFGARAAAGNTIDDIRALCDFAHIYNVSIYVALNTILRDDELKEAEQLIGQLYDAGVDALIVQDVGITRLDIPPIALHASTQMDNCTPEKVDFLARAGFEQVVLARELTLEEIRRIADRVPEGVALEAFVHGALCVSYSGRCYLSAAMTGRSANRGACAQCCRLPYTMVDADGRTIARNKHLLSLRDMNRAHDLEAMIAAGITSFKIEGRLKDVAYVKNVTAYYRQRLDEIIARDASLRRASDGRSTFTFEPRPEKSFNRGFTDYFLHGRRADITSFDTPKSIGEPIGRARTNRSGWVVEGTKPLHNGDGLVFFNPNGELEGFRVNRAEGQRIVTARMPAVKPGTMLYRNVDSAFEAILSKPSANRRIAVDMTWCEQPDGFALTLTDASGCSVTVTRDFAAEPAVKPQEDNIRTQLSRLGTSPFEATRININMPTNTFVPSSLLSEMRREAVERLLSERCAKRVRRLRRQEAPGCVSPTDKLDYTANIYNAEAEAFYHSHGVQAVERAYEEQPRTGVALMFTRHCLRYSMGWCPVHQRGRSPFREPYYLLYEGTRLRLEFDCTQCEMRVVDAR